MYYKSEDIDKLLEELRIEDVVGEYVALKKSGSNYKGLCPFHADTNPSFIVNPNKNICKCFVCEAGGNPITFYSKYKKIGFNEAIKELAQKYKINIKEQHSKKNTQILEKYYEIMEASHNFFKEKMFSLEARSALDYLSNRGLDSKLIKEYQLGYAPSKWSELYDYLLQKGYIFEDIYELGLIKKNEDKIYDAFRNRIIYPIYSSYGRIIAFGGRALESNDKIPKYINSPDTPIFKKGNNIYGIERARTIKEKNYSILMEGYMDVLSACVYGFDTSIAPLGTALTDEQAKLLKKYSSNVLISFDMDKAGIAATERASYILKNNGFNIRVLEFKNAKDPDEFLKKYGRESFLNVVKNSVEIFDFLYNLYLSEYDLKNVISKQNFIEKFKDFFSCINDKLEKEIYLKRFSQKVDIDIEILRDVLIKNNKKYTKFKLPDENTKKQENDNVLELEMSIVKILFVRPEYYMFFKNKTFETEFIYKIFKFFDKKIKDNLFIDSNNIMKDFKHYIENSDEFTEYEKDEFLAFIVMDYVLDFFPDNKKILDLFKSYFRHRIKVRDKSQDNFEKIIKIGKFINSIEETKNIEDFMKIYNIHNYLLNKKTDDLD